MQAASHQLIAHVARDHHQYLRGYARRLCRESADADDLMQDVFVSAVAGARGRNPLRFLGRNLTQGTHSG